MGVELTITNQNPNGSDLPLHCGLNRNKLLSWHEINMYTHTLTWNRCEGNKWCPFLTVNLNHVHFRGMTGIYIVWHGGQNPRTVYVGQGNIAERIAVHRSDPSFLQYSSLGLFVTWASVPGQAARDGIERYLADQLRPMIGEAYPNVPPVGANLPW